MRLVFGDVAFDSGSRQVWRSGQEVHLTRKAYELLALLIERRPNALSKQEIHAHLWPDTFVSDVNLQTLIFEIRSAIGDEARKSTFIRTVHGFGYAFNGPAKELPDPTAAGRVRAWLVGELGRLVLYEGENILGREGDDVIELLSGTVSRRHARVACTAERATIEDLGSKNGTFVGDRQIHRPVSLNDGDRVRLGAVLLTFRVAASEGSTVTASAILPPPRDDETSK